MNNMKQCLLLLLFILLHLSEAESQTISGTLTGMVDQEIHLDGFNGFNTYGISQSEMSDNGSFTLSYSEENIGMGQLVSSNGGSFVVVLSGENIELFGESLSFPESIEINSGKSNLLFEQYASEHQRREQALSAWIYLQRMYQSDSLFAVQPDPKEAIIKEIERIRKEDDAFIDELSGDSYIRWYLPVRRLVQSVPVVAQFRTEEITQTIRAFRELDHTDERMYKSGLLGDVLESHIWLIENSGRSLDSVYVELNHSIDILARQLSSEPDLFNEIMEYLFDLLEERSLFTSSDHLALNLLEHRGELLTSRFANKLELYRAMKPGNTAPDFHFTENTFLPDGIIVDRLSEIDTNYFLVVFAAGWCQECRELMPDINAHYKEWQNEGVKVVLVSLDETPEDFEQFAGDLPFIRTTDFQKWNSPMVKDYHVHSIPSMILLDNQREILIHPNSVQHMDAWMDWYLVQGNF